LKVKFDSLIFYKPVTGKVDKCPV